MMATVSAILWLCITYQIIAVESQKKSKVSQIRVYEKCHHYMPIAMRTECFYNHVDDKLNAVQENVTEIENQLNICQRSINSSIDDIHGNISRIDDIIKNISLEHVHLKSDFEKNSQTVDDTMAKLDQTVSEVRDNIDKVDSERKTDFQNQSTSLNQLSRSLREEIGNLDKKFDDKIENVQNSMSEETNKLQQHVDNKNQRLVGNFHSQIKGLDDKLTGVQKQIGQTVDSQYGKLIQLMENIDLDLKNSLEKIDKDMTENIQVHDTKIGKLSHRLDSEVSELGNRIDSEVKSLKDVMNSNLLKSENQVKEVLKTLDEKVYNLETLLSQFAADVEKRIERVKDEIDKTVVNIQMQVSDVDKKVDNLQKKLEGSMEAMRREIGEEIQKQAQDLSSKTVEVNQTVTQHKSTLDVVHANTFDKGMLILAILFLFVCLGINSFIVYIIVKRTKPDQVSSSNVRNLSGGSEPLMNTISVISFSDQSQKHNKRLMKVLQDELPVAYGDRVLHHMIRRHEDIPETPLTKLCFMFVEFTERHVIIEVPGLGLGDLKRKTFTYVTESGACLVIIYVKDPESKRLTDDLYNHNIHCVSSQPELMSLRDQDRFISIYDKFNDCQSDCLLNLIRDTIK